MSLGATCQTCGCTESSCSPCNNPSECSNCASCCCSADHRFWRLGRIRAGVRLEYVSTGWMAVEVAGALLAAALAGSLALLAFGADSVVELISSVAVLSHLKGDAGGSDSPGSRTSKFTAALLFSLVPLIGATALGSYAMGLRPEASPLGIAVAVGSLSIMPFLWLGKRRIGDETRCLPLAIDAVESVTCVLMSGALLAGLVAGYLYGLWWADYAAAAVITAFVAKEALESIGKMRGRL